MDRKTQLMSLSAYTALASQLGVAPEDFPDPLYVVDRLGRVAFCNRALGRLVEQRAEDIVGGLSLLLYPAEATPVILARRMNSLVGDAVSRKLRTEIRRSGGGTIPVELSVTSLRDEGEIVGRVVVVREVQGPGETQRGREPPHVEHLLQLSPEEANALPYGLIVLDSLGVVISYNDAESRLSGLAGSEVIGRNFFLEIAPCTRVRTFAGLYRQMVETGEPDFAQFEFLFRFPYGEKRVFILMGYSREMKQGAILVEQRPHLAT